MLLATLVPLQAVAFGLVALGAPLVVLTRDPLRQALVNGIYGLVADVQEVQLCAEVPGEAGRIHHRRR